MAKLELSSVAHATKKLYPTEKLQELLYKNNPFLARVPKWTKFVGESFHEAVIYGPGAGRGTTIAKAQSSYSGHKGKAFILTRVKDYAIAELDAEAIEACENDSGALVRLLKKESDMAIHRLKRSMAHAFWNDGAGNIGQINSSGVSSGVFTLTNPEDVVHFEVGQVIVANPTRSGTSGNQRSGSGTVTHVNRDTGAITYSGTITSVAASDYIFLDGDYDAKLKGVPAWIPDTAPTSTSFFGVDRSSDTTRLGGVRYDASTGEPLADALQGIATRIHREGGMPTEAYANPTKVLQLAKELGAKVVYKDYSVGKVGFRALQVDAGPVTLDVFSDPNVPVDRIYCLDMSTWNFRTLKEAPRILNLDGLEMARKASDDSYELRFGYYGQLGCNAPGWNGVVKLS